MTSLGNSAGCDGSLFLAPEEIGRQENSGLNNVIPPLGQLAQKHNVGVADFFQFAGGEQILMPYICYDSNHASLRRQNVPGRTHCPDFRWPQGPEYCKS